MKKQFIFIIFAVFLFLTVKAEVKVENAVVTYVYGIVKHKPSGTEQWNSLKLNDKLNIGDSIKTGRRSKAEINISGKKIIKIKPDSMIEIPEVVENQGGIIQSLKLMFGYIYVNGKKIDGEFNVQTPKAICGIRGTRYTLEVMKNGREILTVLAGRVHYGSNDKKISKLIDKGQKLEVTKAEETLIKSINIIKEESKVIKEFLRKESEKIENAVEELLGNISEEQLNNVRPTEKPSVGTTKKTGSVHISW
ncbi:MAG: FecR domain-containing protein [Candidatus Muirbacterium halophilum]|nr:FecR domain-containing protein [Candidatus Muirbacterium halophilum]MCK9474510.1 FecR domain-containing protein [Candidatus Muirbacterium halophilum]